MHPHRRWTGLVAVLVAAACSKEAPPAAETPRTAAEPPRTAATSEPPATASAPPAASPPAARLSEESFDLAIAPVGEVAAGKPAKLEIVLDAKGEYKVNEEYPHKFQADEAPGVTFAQNPVKRDAAKLETKKLTLPIVFTAAEAGRRKITGKLSFSVCTPERCLLEKRDLALEIDVK